MKLFGSHLAEDALFDCYLAERHGEGMAEAGAARTHLARTHLARCSLCARRLDELRLVMDDIRTYGDHALERAFSVDALEAQRHEIARRIAHIGRSARVIAFPAATTTVSARSSPERRGVSRWITVAAVAGLIVGLGAGRTFDGRRRTVPGAATGASASVTPASVTPGTSALGSQTAPGWPQASARLEPPGRPDIPDVIESRGSAGNDARRAPDSARLAAEADRTTIEDAFFSELDGVDEPRTAELAAYDALTPHVREISLFLPGR